MVVEDFGIAEDGGLGDAFMGRVMVPLSEVATIAHKYCKQQIATIAHKHCLLQIATIALQ